MKFIAAISLLVALACVRASEPPPSGLAASALQSAHFTWLKRNTSGFRVYFKEGGYAAQHQDSLMARLPLALHHARALIHATAPQAPIDVFFIDSRDDMAELIGGRARRVSRYQPVMARVRAP